MKKRTADLMKRRQSQERSSKSHQMNQKLKTTMKMMRTKDRTIRTVVVRRKMKTRQRRNRSSVPLN